MKVADLVVWFIMGHLLHFCLVYSRGSAGFWVEIWFPQIIRVSRARCECSVCVCVVVSGWAEAGSEWVEGWSWDGELRSGEWLRQPSVLGSTVHWWPQHRPTKDLCQRQIVRTCVIYFFICSSFSVFQNAIWILKITKFYWLTGSEGLSHITMPNFVKIGHLLQRYINFSRWPPHHAGFLKWQNCNG